jgi:hypothetical protein
VKNDNNMEMDTVELTRQTISKLNELCNQQNVSADQLILELLDKFGKGVYKSEPKERSAKNLRPQPILEGLKERQTNVQVDLSKLLPFANNELIELLRRIAQSIENIERSHEQGWSDQRKDLGAIGSKLDKLL